MSGCWSNLRRSRTIVCTWAMAFVAAQIGLAFALEKPLEILRDPDYATRSSLLRKRIAEVRGHPVIVVLGTSRTLNGIRPELISANSDDVATNPLVFNFSLPGHGPTHLYVVLKHLLRDGIRPDGLVLELVPHQLAINVSQASYMSALSLSRGDLQESLPFHAKPEELSREWWTSRAIPCYSYRFHFMNRFLSSWIPVEKNLYGWQDLDRWGWKPQLSNGGAVPSPETTRQRFSHHFQNYRIASVNENAVQLILKLCRSERIAVTVLFMPEGPSFRSCYSPEAVRAVAEFQQRLRNEFEIPIVDAREWLDSDHFFADGHHLLPEGAAEFTKRFAREVLPHFNMEVRKTRECENH